MIAQPNTDLRWAYPGVARHLTWLCFCVVAICLASRGGAQTPPDGTGCFPPPSGLNAWYPGDGNAGDVRGGASGTLKNGVTFEAGKVRQAFSLDGVDDYVEIPHNRTLNNPPRITLAAWIRPDTIKAGSRIISKDSSTSSCTAPTVNYSLEARGLQGNKADFFFTTSDNAFHELVGTSVLPTGVFTHVAATFDGTTAKIYVNGVLENSVAVAGASLARSNAPVIIGGGGAGCRATNSGQIEFDGLIDEVEIYKRALSGAEIKAIVDAGSAGKCQELPILQTAQFNGNTYHLLAGPTSWVAAEEAAVKLGGHLVTINGAEENAFVLNTFGPTASARGGKASLWLGLSDRRKEGSFVWSSGQAVGYTNWSSGQPQGTSGADEDFVGMFVNFGDIGRWHDIVSDNRLGDVTYGVVEIGPKTVWAAGRDLRFNEKPDNAAEANATNTVVPEWSYGHRSFAAGTAFTPFTPQSHRNESIGIEGWLSSNNVQVLVSVRSEPLVIASGFSRLYPAQMYLHPGSNNDFAVVRWTAPAAGYYRVQAEWLDLDPNGGNGASAHVVVNGAEVFGRTVGPDQVGPKRFVGQDWDNGGNAEMPAQTFKLKAGEVIDFAVGSRGDSSFDATTFNAIVARVPGVEITNAPPQSRTDQGVELPAGADVTLEVAVDSSKPVASVTLLVNGTSDVQDTTAPYSLTQTNLRPGAYYYSVKVTDVEGVESVSEQIKVRALPVPPSGTANGPADGGKETDRTIAAANSGGLFYVCTQSGSWNNPATWGGAGVPGRNDDAVIYEGFAVHAGDVEMNSLDLHGSLVIGSPNAPRRFVVYGNLLSKGLIEGGDPSSQLLVFDRLSSVSGRTRFQDLSVFVSGTFIVTGDGSIDAPNTVLVTSGRSTLYSPPGTNRPVVVRADRFEFSGGAHSLDNYAQIIAPNGIITHDGASVKGIDASRIITHDGASIITHDGASIINSDGAGIAGVRGTPLVGLDGGSLVGQDGGSLVSRALIRGSQQVQSPTASPGSVAAEATGGPGISLESGTLSGKLNLIGNVVNGGGFISPGASAGEITVSGDYAQQSGGTLLMEVGGIETDPLEFDQLLIDGTANLGGKLIVNSIDGYTPASADIVSPLLFASRSGNFESISSNAQISFDSEAMTMQVSGPNPPAPKALNISTRMPVETGDNVLIAGFIVTGSSPKKVLLRGIGPSLPVSGPLADPVLSLDNGAVVNDDWQSTQEQAIRDTTIPPSRDLESAIVATLQPGPHTAVLRGKNNGTGVGLVEVYDLESGTPVQLANISTRGQVQAGDNVMIGGFIIGGDYPAKVLLRAIGPSLSVNGKLEDPTLELVDAQGNIISNDNWRATQEAEITATTVPPTNDKEAAIVATLVPGFYTAIVRGKDDTAGVALVEGYNLQ